jgi:hypothetical protein
VSLNELEIREHSQEKEDTPIHIHIINNNKINKQSNIAYMLHRGVACIFLHFEEKKKEQKADKLPTEQTGNFLPYDYHLGFQSKKSSSYQTYIEFLCVCGHVGSQQI